MTVTMTTLAAQSASDATRAGRRVRGWHVARSLHFVLKFDIPCVRCVEVKSGVVEC